MPLTDQEFFDNYLNCVIRYIYDDNGSEYYPDMVQLEDDGLGNYGDSLSITYWAYPFVMPLNAAMQEDYSLADVENQYTDWLARTGGGVLSGSARLTRSPEMAKLSLEEKAEAFLEEDQDLKQTEASTPEPTTAELVKSPEPQPIPELTKTQKKKLKKQNRQRTRADSESPTSIVEVEVVPEEPAPTPLPAPKKKGWW